MATDKDNASETKLPLVGLAASNDVVVVEVGPELKRYTVHKDLLTYHSEYFLKALGGSWKEAQEGVVSLKDADTRVFNLFVHWLYTKVLPDPVSAGDDWDRITKTEEDEDQPERIYIDAYVFGDRYIALEFRRVIHETLDSRLKEYYLWGVDSISSIATAYLSIPSHLPIRQQLVDLYCENWDAWSNKDCGEQMDPAFSSQFQKGLPTAFLVRVMKRLYELRSGKTFEMEYDETPKLRCYIDHTSDAEKEDCDDLHEVR
ncbi:hypothetical protein EJ07DRAFT_156556 [Lizonia empirigonia]|nr:hypothetical protein EJ07DRAFT_156556 [Lizonia empirigonia]